MAIAIDFKVDRINDDFDFDRFNDDLTSTTPTTRRQVGGLPLGKIGNHSKAWETVAKNKE